MNDDPIPSEYHSDHLFLLIGTNPLPNYVAARLLSKPGGTVYLIHSDDTKPAASRLAGLLVCNGLDNSKRVVVSPGDPEDIYRKVENEVRNVMNKGLVGLNYTGGTKTMAVHAYRAVERLVENSGKRVIFSYLDANDLNMVIDPIDTACARPFSTSLAFDMPLVDLLKLHDCALAKDPVTEVVLPKAASALAMVHKTEEGIEKWQKWCECELREKGKKPNDKWKSPTELRDVELKWPQDAILMPGVEAIQEELGNGPSSVIILESALKTNVFSKPSQFCAWLDGTWLEHYTLDQIHSIQQECQIGDVAMSLVHESSRKHFEFDIGVMRGYQLFAISCSTSLELSKSKLFEAYVRARQLGGDEARVGLVYGKDPDRLRQQVESEWDAKGKFRVFGPQDLPDLAQHLADWFGKE